MESHSAQTRKARQCREFDLLTPPKHSRVELRFAGSDDLEKAFKFAEGQIPGGLAEPETVEQVIAHNPKSVFLFWSGEEIAGLYATLPLSPLGLERLLLGELNTNKPSLDCVAAEGQTPAGIYNWVVIAPRLAAEGIQHVSLYLRTSESSKANLFSRPNTSEGVAINQKLGFVPIRCGTPGLYRYTRLCNRPSSLEEAA